MWTVTGFGGDEVVALEVGFARQSVSYADDASWGWWSPEKYDEWQAFDDASFELSEAQILIGGDVYTVIFGYETYPDLRGEGSFEHPTSGEQVGQALLDEIQVYDAAIAQLVKRRRGYLMPWVGLTRIAVDGRRISSIGGSPVDQPADESKTRLWGAVLGVAGGFDVADRVFVTGRVVVRWARGDRDASFTPVDDSGEPGIGRVEISDTVTQAMWGAEAGVRWSAFNGFSVEGGWRIRDWQYDDGPARFSGPFARVGIVF